MTTFTHRRTVRIEWGDCDPAQIVFYPRYFAMFDASTWALFAAATGRTKRQMVRELGVVGCPMVDTRAAFRLPSRYGDVVSIESQQGGAALAELRYMRLQPTPWLEPVPDSRQEI